RDGPSRTAAIACFVLLGSLPWFGLAFVPPGLVVAWSAVRSLRRASRGLLALASTEVAFFSLALLVGLNEALFGGPTPHAADSPWRWIDARSGGALLTNRPSAPWGPLVHVFPEFNGGVWPYALLAAVAAALAAPVVRKEIEVRRRLG